MIRIIISVIVLTCILLLPIAVAFDNLLVFGLITGLVLLGYGLSVFLPPDDAAKENHDYSM